MYNIDFLPQMEKFRKYVFGAGCVDTRAAAEEAFRNSWVPHKDSEIVPCIQAESGEYVPEAYVLEKSLEELASETTDD